MKLKILKEVRSAAEKRPLSEALLSTLQNYKSDLKMSDIAWFASFYYAEIDYSTRDLAYLFYYGVISLRDNQEEIDQALYDKMENDLNLDGSLSPEAEAEGFKRLIVQAKDFFNIK